MKEVKRKGGAAGEIKDAGKESRFAFILRADIIDVKNT